MLCPQLLLHQKAFRMIKGVNRQIIEVTDTGSVYYEKAYLVVRPQFRQSQEALLERHAKRTVSQLKPPYAIRTWRVITSSLLKFLFSAATGALTTLALINFFA